MLSYLSSDAVSRRVAGVVSLVALSLLSACGGGGSAGTGSDALAQASSSTESLLSSSDGLTDTKKNPASTGTTTTTTSPTTSVPNTSVTTPPATTTTTPTTTARIIDYYGDSTVWGYGSGTGIRVDMPAPAAFAAALPASGNYQVRNEGVSGSTACQLLNGTDGKHPVWDTQLANSGAHVVVFNHGINDEWKMDLSTYKSCLHTLAQKTRAAGKKVVFETPNPTRDSYAAGLDTWAQAMRDVAREEGAPVIDQYSYLKAYLNGASPYTICPDGLHPTAEVYVLKGKYAASVWSGLNLGL